VGAAVSGASGEVAVGVSESVALLLKVGRAAAMVG